MNPDPGERSDSGSFAHCSAESIERTVSRLAARRATASAASPRTEFASTGVGIAPGVTATRTTSALTILSMCGARESAACCSRSACAGSRYNLPGAFRTSTAAGAFGSWRSRWRRTFASAKLTGSVCQRPPVGGPVSATQSPPAPSVFIKEGGRTGGRRTTCSKLPSRWWCGTPRASALRLFSIAGSWWSPSLQRDTTARRKAFCGVWCGGINY